MASAALSLPGRALMRVRDAVHDWAFRRQGLDSIPLCLARRRLYILPTRVGLVFGAILFAMLLGSMNYNNSMGLALTFGLAALGLVTMHHCHRNLLGLMVQAVGAEPVFAGQALVYRVRLQNSSPEKRYQVSLRWEGCASSAHDLPPNASLTLELALPARPRGLYRLPRLSITSQHPFMFFRCWTWLHLDAPCLVYPSPSPPGPEPPRHDVDVGSAQHDGMGSEDFAGLRTYRPGDSPRHIAWKAFARDRELLVKQFAGTALTTLWLDFATAPGRDTEQRLQRLCRWVLSSDAAGWAYGLRLPGHEIQPGSGRGHRAKCLAALALFGIERGDAR